jgi:hypothetical protein
MDLIDWQGLAYYLVTSFAQTYPLNFSFWGTSMYVPPLATHFGGDAVATLILDLRVDSNLIKMLICAGHSPCFIEYLQNIGH